MNFELLLVVLTGITGLIWFVDYFTGKLKVYRSNQKNSSKRSVFVVQAVSFFPIFLIVLDSILYPLNQILW